MRTIPLAEEQVADDLLILDLENVGLSDEQFIELCSDNDELSFELTAQKELVIMTPPRPGTGRPERMAQELPSPHRLSLHLKMAPSARPMRRG